MEDKKTEHTEEHAPGKHITHEALHDLIHFDRKIIHTIPVLLFKPGKLTQSALSGQDSKYVRPFALFVFINFLYFLLKSPGIFAFHLSLYANDFADTIKETLAGQHISLEILTERFNTAMHFEQKEYMVIIAPLLALILQLLYLSRWQHFTRHLVFSLHFYTFFIIFIVVFPWIFKPVLYLSKHGLPALSIFNTDNGVAITVILACLVYIFFALKRVYGGNTWLTLLKATTLSVALIFLMVGFFRIFMFYVVMHAIAH